MDIIVSARLLWVLYLVFFFLHFCIFVFKFLFSPTFELKCSIPGVASDDLRKGRFFFVLHKSSLLCFYVIHAVTVILRFKGMWILGYMYML